MCVHCTAQLLHTILHRIDLIIFPSTLQTFIIAPMVVVVVVIRKYCLITKPIFMALGTIVFTDIVL